MRNEELLLATSAAAIVFSTAVLVQRLKKRRRYRIRPSLLARRKYSATDFTRYLILDDENLLGLE